MPLILNIETTGTNCSVALSKDTAIQNIKEDKEGRAHASRLAVFIDEILKEEQLAVKDLDAVSISKGPGSYTGLRIGVSTAKGLCYGSGVPLVSVHTLQALNQYLLDHMADYGISTSDDPYLVPMIDARRMEVYTAVFDRDNRFVRDVKAEIIDEKSFEGMLGQHKMVFFGNGAAKCKEVIRHDNALFLDNLELSAKNMVSLSEKQFLNKQFEDVAYFEPFYLKDFQATTPKKPIL